MDQSGFFEKAYTTSEIANMVGIAQSTVRKYSQVLERAGYVFTKNKNGGRLFVKKDIEVLEQMKEYSIESSMPINRIAKMLIGGKTFERQEAVRTITGPDLPQKSDNIDILGRYDKQFSQIIEKLSKFDQVLEENRQLKEELRQVRESLETDAKVKDERDQQLINVLSELQKASNEIAVSKEKKSFWGRLFK